MPYGMDHRYMVSTNPPNDDPFGLGVAITTLMNQRDISRNALADAAGVPRSSFYRKIDQRPETFTARELFDIARALNVPLSELLDAA
jgi:transcriptional regulator with XRE-family HTH domain